jgi:ABC-2 type transport system permease protein
VILEIALHETRRHLRSFGFWLLLASAQLLLAWLFFAQVEVLDRLAPQLVLHGASWDIHDLVIVPTLSTALLMVIFIAPLLSMQSLAGELQSGRIAHWLTAPFSSHVIVGGKLLGDWLALCLMLGSLFLTLCSLALAYPLDMARLLCGLLGLLLFGLMATAIGLFFSSLTRQPPIALAGSLATLLFLWLLDSLLVSDSGANWLALLPHVKPLQSGLVQSADVLYFLLIALGAAWLASFRLAIRRGET